MPLFLKGRGNYFKLCEVCGKPFKKTARVQRRCEGCKSQGVQKKHKTSSLNIEKAKHLNSSIHK